MKIRIFSIYDKAAEAWLPPFFLPMQGMAIRAFTDCVNDAKHKFCAHPEDYTLAEIGEYDDSSARINSYPTPSILLTGIQAKKIPIYTELEQDQTGINTNE